jgi:hypothetical protein
MGAPAAAVRLPPNRRFAARGRLSRQRHTDPSAVAEGRAESAAEEAKTARLGTSASGVMQRSAEAPHDVWCWDFVFDRTTSGSPLKWLSIVDEFTRECIVLKVDRGITSEAVIDWLAELFAMRGVPRCIRSDNGPEFIAHAIRRWLAQVGVETLYIEPGRRGRRRWAVRQLRDAAMRVGLRRGCGWNAVVRCACYDKCNSSIPSICLGIHRCTSSKRSCAGALSSWPKVSSSFQGSCGDLDLRLAAVTSIP